MRGKILENSAADTGKIMYTSLKWITDKDCSILWTGSIYDLFVKLSLAAIRLSPPPKIDEIPQVEPLGFPDQQLILPNFRISFNPTTELA